MKTLLTEALRASLATMVVVSTFFLVGCSAAPKGASESATSSAASSIDVCGAPSQSIAWTESILPAGSTSLTLSQVGVGLTDNVMVSDVNGANYEQYRWDSSGNPLSQHQDPIGLYAGPLSVSNLAVDVHDNLFYGAFFTGYVQGTENNMKLVFNKLTPTGGSLIASSFTGQKLTSHGAFSTAAFDVGTDSSGGTHGAIKTLPIAVFSAGNGVYCYASNNTFSGVSAPTPTNALNPGDFEWPAHVGGLYYFRRVSVNTNLGCGTLTVPPGGAVVLAHLTGLGACVWNTLLNLPTAATLAQDFRVGADGSLLASVVYSGTIDFGGGPLQSVGNNSLAVARFSGTGSLLYAKSFGGTGSSFQLGNAGVNASGILMVTAGYSGTVDLGGGPLSSSSNTFVSTFDSSGNFRWADTVTVTAPGTLVSAVGSCGVYAATNSPTVDFGSGPLSSGTPPSIGAIAIGL